MPGTRTLAAMTALCALQGAPIDGTWELTRVFRSGAAPAATRAVALDSTVYVRITLESHPGGWISGRLYRRYHGEPDRSKVEAGPLRGTGDRKSTRLNSSHLVISYAVFCLKKKKKTNKKQSLEIY